MQYDGTIILVSHDRAFLSGLAERVIEFHEGIVREFPGDIDVYLNQNIQSFSNNLFEVNDISKKKSGIQLYKRKKKLDKSIRILKKQNEKLELEISEIEKNIETLKQKLEKNELENIDYNQYNKLNEQLNFAMSNWEKVQINISEEIKNRNKLV